MLVQTQHGFVKLPFQQFHLSAKRLHLILTDQSDTRLWIRQGHGLPKRDNAAFHVAYRAERRVLGVQQFFSGGQIRPFGSKGVSGDGPLFGREGLARSEPGQRYSHCRRGRAKPLGRRRGWAGHGFNEKSVQRTSSLHIGLFLPDVTQRP
jgi:hypothetical protein